MTILKSRREPVILGSARTPQGKFLGSLASLNAAQLGQLAVKAVVERSGINTNEIDEVIIGNVVSAGVGQALPRQISLAATIPDHVGGSAINKVCGSSLKAVMVAANAIKADDGNLYIAGGVESMSRAPYLNDTIRQGNKYGAVLLRDALQTDGLWCALCDWGMGSAAEYIAEQFLISRDAMDQFALRSHQLAAKAIDGGYFANEITPVIIKSRKGETVFDTDESIRRDTTLESLAKLPPAFKPDGTVTAGNAPGMTDGASAIVVASREYADHNHLQPIARITGYAQAAVDPKELFYAPVKAIPIALERAGWSMADIDLFELNEAFAAQVLADIEGLKQLGYELPLEKLNVHGGAIALGHPLGASGARVLITLVHALQRHNLKRGIAALCLGGGEAVALTVELE